jgi:hypothetical protein
MIRYSTFVNSFGVAPISVTDSFPKFAECLSKYYAVERPACEDHKKYQTPLISPAVFKAGTNRANINVECWGSVIGLDMDSGAMTVDEAGAVMQEFASDYAIYTTTKSTVEHQRYRIFAPLDRDVEAADVPKFWRGLSELFSGMIDPQTKDLARMYYVPATWLPDSANGCPYNRFEAVTEGRTLMVDDIMAMVPADAVIAAPVFAKPTTELEGSWKPTNPLIRQLYLNGLVTPKIEADYRKVQKGDHHQGLFKFMVAVGFEAKRRNYPLTIAELIDLAKQIDSTNTIKTNPNRWQRMDYEASRALGFVRDHFKNEN